MHGLEAVARVGQRPLDDDRHRVVEEGALHLLLELDRLDRTEPRTGTGLAVAVVGGRCGATWTHLATSFVGGGEPGCCAC